MVSIQFVKQIELLPPFSQIVNTGKNTGLQSVIHEADYFPLSKKMNSVV